MSVMGLLDVSGGLNLGAAREDFNGADLYSTPSVAAPCSCCNISGCTCKIGGGGGGGGGGGSCSLGSSPLTWGSTAGAHPFDPLSTPGLAGVIPPPPCVCCPLGDGGPNALGTTMPRIPLPGLALASVPGPGAAFSQPVNVFSTNIGGSPLISGILVRCSESGATLISGCSNVTFYQNSGGTRTYTALAGIGVECRTSLSEIARTATTTGTVPNVVALGVHTSPA